MLVTITPIFQKHSSSRTTNILILNKYIKHILNVSKCIIEIQSKQNSNKWQGVYDYLSALLGICHDVLLLLPGFHVSLRPLHHTRILLAPDARFLQTHAHNLNSVITVLLHHKQNTLHTRMIIMIDQ